MFAVITTSTESFASSSRAAFSGHGKKRNIKSLLLPFLSIFFPPIFQTPQQPSKGKRLFLFLPLQGPGRECIVQWSKDFLLQMKTKIHPSGWIINNTHALETQCPHKRSGWKREGRHEWENEMEAKWENMEPLDSVSSVASILNPFLRFRGAYCGSSSGANPHQVPTRCKCQNRLTVIALLNDPY